MESSEVQNQESLFEINTRLIKTCNVEADENITKKDKQSNDDFGNPKRIRRQTQRYECEDIKRFRLNENENNVEEELDQIDRDYSSDQSEEYQSRKTKRSKKRFKCPMKNCKSDFCSSSNMLRHLRLHSDGRLIRQKSKIVKMKLKKNINKKFIRVKEKRIYKCYFCNEEFSTILLRNRHVESIHDSTEKAKYTCDVNSCNKVFSDKKSLIEHVDLHRNEKPYKCPIKYCGKRFVFKTYVKHHLKIHFNDRPYECNVEGCHKTFRWETGFKYHIKSHLNEKSFECTFEGCGKLFINSAGLKLHYRTHTNETRYKCPHCLKKFKQRPHLVSHVRIHTGEKPFKCRFCEKTFRQTSHLRIHERIHTGEKPYKCTFKRCNKSFTTNESCKTHYRIHSGERPFRCPIKNCYASFNQSHVLKSHLKSHAEEKLSCENCGCAFESRRDLKKHKINNKKCSEVNSKNSLNSRKILTSYHNNNISGDHSVQKKRNILIKSKFELRKEQLTMQKESSIVLNGHVQQIPKQFFCYVRIFKFLN